MRGSGGIYDIHVDGELLYSRKASGHQFPDEDADILGPLRERLDS